MAITKLVVNKALNRYRLIPKAGGYEVVVTDQENQATTVVATVASFDAATGALLLTIDGVFYKVHVVRHQTAQGVVWQVVFAHATAGILVATPMTTPALDGPESQKLIQANGQGLFVPAKASVVGPSLAAGKVLKSPLAGRVSRIVVTPGQRVERGQPILYIESMKMENEIGAPSPAFIKTILIAEGNVIQPEQILVEFEGEGVRNAATKNGDEPAPV